jgi:hypothetical protein
MSNRASSLIPIPEFLDDGELIPLINERLRRTDGELGRLDARIDGIDTTVAAPVVEVNTAITAVATAGVVGGAGYANVTGCQLTLPADGLWLIHATICGIINIAGSLMVGQVLVTPLVGAPAALPENIVLLGAAGHHATVSQSWLYQGLLSDQLDLQMVGVGTATDPVTPGVGFSSTITALWVGA